jgi:hypothetical protein
MRPAALSQPARPPSVTAGSRAEYLDAATTVVALDFAFSFQSATASGTTLRVSTRR